MGLYDKEPDNNQTMVTEEYLDNLTLADYGLTPEEVKGFMFGYEVRDPKTGKLMDDAFYNRAIENALSQVENDLDIAIFPRPIKEKADYNETEFNNYQYLNTMKKPVIQVDYLGISLNGQTLRQYPKQWWSVYNRSGQVEVMPSPYFTALGGRRGGALPLLGAPFNVTHPERAVAGNGTAPQLFELWYVAGLLPRQNGNYNSDIEMPASLETLILKYAVREIMQLWGRLLVTPGVAGSSINIDGIAESRSTTQSAMYSAVSADLNQVQEDIDKLTNTLRKYFGGSMTIV